MLRSGLAYTVGIDIGTYNLRLCLSDLNGTVLAVEEMRSEMFRGSKAVLSSVFSLVRELLGKSGIAESSLQGIGIGFSGVIGAKNGTVLSYPRPGQMEQWKDMPLREISSAFPLHWRTVFAPLLSRRDCMEPAGTATTLFM